MVHSDTSLALFLYSIQRYDPVQSDAWSMGVVLYVMLVGHYPFTRAELRLMAQDVAQGRYSSSVSRILPKSFSPSLVLLFERLFCLRPWYRCTVDEARTHAWTLAVESQSPVPTQALSVTRYVCICVYMFVFLSVFWCLCMSVSEFVCMCTCVSVGA